MNTLHKAAQAAIEALQLPCGRWNAVQYKIVTEAAENLRAALAQEPAQQEARELASQALAALEEHAKNHKLPDDQVYFHNRAVDELRKELAQEPAQPALAREDSEPASRAIAAMLREYDYPANPTNAARAGWRAARLFGDIPQPAAQEPAQQPEAQYVSIDELGDLLQHVTPADRWIEGELDRIDPHRHEQGHDGAEVEALRKLVFEFHLACDLLISHCNKHPTMGDSLFSVVLMRQLLGRGRDDVKGPT